jgi:hypothetical protein
MVDFTIQRFLFLVTICEAEAPWTSDTVRIWYNSVKIDIQTEVDRDGHYHGTPGVLDL